MSIKFCQHCKSINKVEFLVCAYCRKNLDIKVYNPASTAQKSSWLFASIFSLCMLGGLAIGLYKIGAYMLSPKDLTPIEIANNQIIRKYNEKEIERCNLDSNCIPEDVMWKARRACDKALSQKIEYHLVQRNFEGFWDFASGRFSVDRKSIIIFGNYIKSSWGDKTYQGPYANCNIELPYYKVIESNLTIPPTLTVPLSGLLKL